MLCVLVALLFHPLTNQESNAREHRDVGVRAIVGSAPSIAWTRDDVKAVDDVNDVPGGLEGADLLAFYFREKADALAFRVSMTQMQNPGTREPYFDRDRPVIVVLMDYADGGSESLPSGIQGAASIEWEEAVVLDAFAGQGDGARGVSVNVGDTPVLTHASVVPAGEYVQGGFSATAGFRTAAQAPEIERPLQFEVISVVEGRVVDRLVTNAAQRAVATNCAFVLHGNQGLAYSDAFYGRWDDPSGSGFDEALEAHQGNNIPGNFHLASTLQTSAEWDNNSGDPNDFNGWLAAGVTAGWAGMVTSAFAQHMMPFVTNDMNDWAVNTETQMINTRYGYYPRVAWVPERVWLHPSFYPNAGVNDDPKDNFVPHGVWAVILDDDVHCQGYDNHQVHTLAGSTLKVLPRDRNFTGNIVGGNGAAALQILTDMANSGVGEFRIATFAEDWEAVAEIGIWATTTPNAKETYDWMINKCAMESAWLSTWKVTDAVSNPNFAGSSSMNVTYGTYIEIGGTGGYGGGNNGWYGNWAGYVPYANGGDGNGACDGGGGNCKNHGTIWNDARNALVAAPDNNISQAGWYCMMTNLHETGWHDGMGGPISGWQLNYSGHIKNTNMYAEAAHWANDEYVTTTAAYFSDIDNDGYDELIMHNDRVFAVIEGIGGRATNVFAKGVDYDFSIIGVDNAYWAGTQADYNDVNHVGAFSDVGPNYQHNIYNIQITQGTGTTVEAVLTHGGLTKRFRLTEGASFISAVYDVGQSTQYIQSGFSPGLVDLIWNAQMDRIWVGDAAYMGQRNPNNGATAALVVSNGGAGHNLDFSGRIMKGDEIMGSGVFEFLLFAGKTSAPDSVGEIPELRALATALTDTIGPGVTSAVYFPGTDKLQINFNQITQYSSFVVTGISIDDDDDGTPELMLSGGTTIIETADSYTLTLQLTPSDAATLEGLNTSALELMLAVNTAFDAASNANPVITNADDISIAYGALTSITIDGLIDPGEWDLCTFAVPDSNDSGWTASNEIDGLYVSWDSVFLYLAIDGVVDLNSWILYIDVDPGGSNGETDLTAIDTWERGTTFTYPGFKADFQYGCYQHQGPSDSDSFFSIDSPTTTTVLTDSIVSAYDSSHLNGDAGGSELAIPWNVLFGLGAGTVPTGASISIVASVCWDPEPGGELGGDSAPSNTSAALPIIDNAFTFVVDADSNSVPDPIDKEAPTLVEAFRSVSSDSLVHVKYSEPVDSAGATNAANYAAFETLVPSNTVPVTGVTLIAPDEVQIALGWPIGAGYSISVSFVTDTSCYENTIVPGSEIAIANGPTGIIPNGPVLTGRLFQNYPNPFNPITTIRFIAPGTDPVLLTVYDVNGRRVKTLVSRALSPGPHEVQWDGTNERGASVSSGVYLYRIVSGNWHQTKKLVLLK
jgi:hypothetical protein